MQILNTERFLRISSKGLIYLKDIKEFASLILSKVIQKSFKVNRFYKSFQLTKIASQIFIMKKSVEINFKNSKKSGDFSFDATIKKDEDIVTQFAALL